MTALVNAVLAGAEPVQLLATPVPTHYRAAHLRREDVGIFGDESDKDVRRSIHIGSVPMPELAPDEVLVAVMASAINFNTVWSAIFEPLPTFDFLARLGRDDPRHDQPFHVIGSDASGVVVRTGAGVRRWRVGQHVVINPVVIDAEDPAAQQDAVSSEGHAWGYESNFGGLADFTVVRSGQLLPKPTHLSWEEAACNTLCAGTAYRMLIGSHGARMKLGDIVLIWGAAGGLGGYAAQLVRSGGGIAVGVVSSPKREEMARAAGCRYVINRQELTTDLQNPNGWRLLGKEIRRLVGEDPHIVFEHTGQETFGASVYVTRRGGTVVTCGSSSGYHHSYDNRHLWMKVKRIVGSHGANATECAEVTRLFQLGLLGPTLSTVYSLDNAADATRAVQLGLHPGKVGVRCLAPADGLGVTDQELRDRLGESATRLFTREEPSCRP
jgi:crotonyl-CoA carboxylase/reductase